MSAEINTFCEKTGHVCTFNYCDENGCQERKRRYTALGISHLEDDALLKHLGENLGNAEQTDLVITEIMVRLGNRSRATPTPASSVLVGEGAENPVRVVLEVLNDWLEENEATDFDENDVAHLFGMLGTAGYSIVPNALAGRPALSASASTDGGAGTLDANKVADWLLDHGRSLFDNVHDGEDAKKVAAFAFAESLIESCAAAPQHLVVGEAAETLNKADVRQGIIDLIEEANQDFERWLVDGGDEREEEMENTKNHRITTLYLLAQKLKVDVSWRGEGHADTHKMPF